MNFSVFASNLVLVDALEQDAIAIPAIAKIHAFYRKFGDLPNSGWFNARGAG